jgi:hypothetical protein
LKPMTEHPTKLFFSGALATAVVASLSSAAFAPQVFSSVLAASGGVLAGMSLLGEQKRSKEQEALEATQVTASFSQLYESNKGIISPQQLSVHTGVPLDRILEFLDNLATEQKGQRITANDTLIYSFPHPKNALSELTANAQNWAAAQTESLMGQIGALQQRLTMLAAHQARNQASSPMPTGLMPLQPLSNDKNDEKRIDPWNNML